jgi:hypothetical protein
MKILYKNAIYEAQEPRLTWIADLTAELRIGGHEKPHIKISVDPDEEDITIYESWKSENPEYYETPSDGDYDEWANQLEIIAKRVRAMKTKSK